MTVTVRHALEVQDTGLSQKGSALAVRTWQPCTCIRMPRDAVRTHHLLAQLDGILVVHPVNLFDLALWHGASGYRKPAAAVWHDCGETPHLLSLLQLADVQP